MHIKQKTTGDYTVVHPDCYNSEDIFMSDCIRDNPELFEVVEGDPPPNYQVLIYSRGE